MFDDIQWLAQDVAAGIARIEAAADREKKMIQLSYKLLMRSEELLRLPVPKVWHPERPNER